MSISIQLSLLIVLFKTVYLYPLHEDDSPVFQNYGMRLAKKSYNPYKEDVLSPFRIMDTTKGRQGQRKKAVDSTFIRFGRSSSSEVAASGEEPSDRSQRFIVDQDGCRVSSTGELMQALMNNPNCIRAFAKAKRESVNDTFIRFGKREAGTEPK